MTTNTSTSTGTGTGTGPGRHIEPSAPRGLTHHVRTWWAARKQQRLQERAAAAYRSRKAAELGY